MEYRISFKKPITTRLGSKVRIYHIYKDYIHGAYKHDEDWYPAQWSLNGFYLPINNNKYVKSALDLINEEPYEQQTA